MRIAQGFQKGINLGGWLSQGELNKEYLDSFIVESDIATIASWGADHIRLPLDFENVEEADGSVKEAGYEYIEKCISWCQKYHLNMVLDLHKTYGYIFDDPEYSKDFFVNRDLQERFLYLWSYMAKRFAPHQDMLMFEILNEVVPKTVVNEWNELAAKAIARIREYCPTVKILYGGVAHNAVTSIKWLTVPADENIVYNFHCYEPMIFTHQSAYWVDDMPLDFHINYPGDVNEYMQITRTIKGAMNGALAEDNVHISEIGEPLFEEIFKEGIEAAERLNVPLYCGEYGVIDQAPPKDTVIWFKHINHVFKKYNIGRAVWTYKEKDFGIIGDHYKDVFDELIANIFE